MIFTQRTATVVGFTLAFTSLASAANGKALESSTLPAVVDLIFKALVRGRTVAVVGCAGSDLPQERYHAG